MKNNRGFTLIELLIVGAIVGILASVAIGTYSHFIDKAKVVSAVSALKSVQSDMKAYLIDNGHYPLDINLNGLVDDEDRPILTSISWDSINQHFFSWESYSQDVNGFTIKAKANDSDHTLITVTDNSIYH